MANRKKEIEQELELYRDLSRELTDPLALVLMKEVVSDLQAELCNEQQEKDSSG